MLSLHKLRQGTALSDCLCVVRLAVPYCTWAAALSDKCCHSGAPDHCVALVGTQEEEVQRQAALQLLMLAVAALYAFLQANLTG